MTRSLGWEKVALAASGEWLGSGCGVGTGTEAERRPRLAEGGGGGTGTRDPAFNGLEDAAAAADAATALGAALIAGLGAALGAEAGATLATGLAWGPAAGAAALALGLSATGATGTAAGTGVLLTCAVSGAVCFKASLLWRVPDPLNAGATPMFRTETQKNLRFAGSGRVESPTLTGLDR